VVLPAVRCGRKLFAKGVIFFFFFFFFFRSFHRAIRLRSSSFLAARLHLVSIYTLSSVSLTRYVRAFLSHIVDVFFLFHTPTFGATTMSFPPLLRPKRMLFPPFPSPLFFSSFPNP